MCGSEWLGKKDKSVSPNASLRDGNKIDGLALRLSGKLERDSRLSGRRL